MKHAILLHLFSVLLTVSGYAQSQQHASTNAHQDHASMSMIPSANISYICPMHSHIVKDHPGACPICGMDLVARENKPATTVTVNVSGEMQQAMALTTESVEYGRLWRSIETYGSVQFDETRLSHIHTRASGWIEKLSVNSQGQTIKKGELLYEIYSPELLVAQEDFLSLLASVQNNQVLLDRGRRRLQLLGFSNLLIKQLEQRKEVLYQVPYFAQQNGIVTELNVREGMFSEPDDSLMTLADLSSVWILADVFQHQIDWVEPNRPVEVDLPALDMYDLQGRVEFIYPTLNPTTRTMSVRLSLKNPEQQLKPGMLATVRIYARPVDALNIPANALIQTEKHNRVFVKNDKGKFERRDVNIGVITQGRAEIISGLEQGERVVTAGQFLLDAEASLSNVALSSNAGDDSKHSGQDAHQHHSH